MRRLVRVAAYVTAAWVLMWAANTWLPAPRPYVERRMKRMGFTIEKDVHNG